MGQNIKKSYFHVVNLSVKSSGNITNMIIADWSKTVSTDNFLDISHIKINSLYYILFILHNYKLKLLYRTLIIILFKNYHIVSKTDNIIVKNIISQIIFCDPRLSYLVDFNPLRRGISANLSFFNLGVLFPFTLGLTASLKHVKLISKP